MSHDEVEQPGADGSAPKRSRGRRFAWWTGTVLVALLALVLMVTRFGPGFVCCGIWPLLLVLLLAWLLGWYRSRPSRAPKGAFVAVLVAAAVYVAAGYALTTPRMLFRRFVASPVPPSVQVLEGRYWGGREAGVHIHFALRPQDLDAILRARPYEAVGPEEDGIIRVPPPPEWWHPQTLANPTAYAARTEDHGVWLWVNESRTEAYFVLLEW